MLDIYLVRHGQDEDNAAGILNGHRDKPLTQLGIQQAERLATRIQQAEITFNKIYTSPLQRASKTADIIAEKLNLPKPERMDPLIERDFGVMTGQPASEIEARCIPEIIKTDTVTYFLAPQNAETFPELLTRAQKVLRSLRQQYSDGSILLVTHGDFGKMLYAAFYGLSWEDTLRQFHFGNSDLLLLSKSSGVNETHVLRTTQQNP